MQGAGDLIVVTGPQGNDVEVTVPEGISAGDVFLIYVEAAAADAEADAAPANTEQEVEEGVEDG